MWHVVRTASSAWRPELKLLLKALIRYLTRQKWSTLSLIAGVTLAIASVAAVHLISDRIHAQLRSAYADTLGGLTHVTQETHVAEARYFEMRARWRRGALPTVQRLMPLVEGDIAVGAARYHLLGFDVVADAVGDMATTVALLTEKAVLAHRAAGLTKGQELALGPDGAVVRVAGLYGDANAEEDVRRNWLIADIATAQEVLDQRGHLTRIGVRLAQGGAWRSWLDKAFPGLGSQIVQDDTVMLADDLKLVSIANQQVERRFTEAILFNLGALSLLSAVVAAFLMYQSGISSLRRRSILFSRLHGMGYTNRVLWGYVLVEGVIVCGFATIMGISLGLLLGEWLITLTSGGAALVSTWGERTRLTPWLLGKSLVFGLGIGVGSMGMAYRAVRLERDRKQRRWLLTAGVFGAFAIVGLGSTSSGLVSPFLALAALCFLMVVLVRPVSLGLSRVLLTWRRQYITVLINLRELQRHIGDVQVALGALLIAMATAIGIGVMVDSFRGSFTEMLAQRLQGDWFLQTDAAGVSPEDLAAIRQLDEVEAVRAYGEQAAWGERGDGRERLMVSYGQLDGWDLARYGFKDGAIDSGDVLISEPMAVRFSVSIGDEIRLSSGKASMLVRVAHVFRDYGRSSPRLFVSNDLAQTLFERTPADRMIVMLHQRGDGGALEQFAVERGWRIQHQERMRAVALNVFDRTFVVTDALTAVGLIVAVMGLYNALTALQLKREREFRLLQAVGLTGWELVRMSVAQSIWLGAIALTLALPLGLSIAWILCYQVNPRAFGWSIPLQPSVAAMAKPLLLGLVATPFAGLLPSLRWVREPVQAQREGLRSDE